MQADHLKKFDICTKFPSVFQRNEEIGAGDAGQDENEDDDSDDSLPENLNRRQIEIETSSDESSGIMGFKFSR